MGRNHRGMRSRLVSASHTSSGLAVKPLLATTMRVARPSRSPSRTSRVTKAMCSVGSNSIRPSYKGGLICQPRSRGRTLPPSYDSHVPYDEDLAERIRELMAVERNVTEKKMFGGLAFLVNGNMAVAASGRGGVLVRADPASAGELVRSGRAEPMVMRGRPVQGWLLVDRTEVRTKRQLAKWVEMGTTH